jgi:hypothetical protein
MRKPTQSEDEKYTKPIEAVGTVKYTKPAFREGRKSRGCLIRHLRNFNASQNAGLIDAVSERALIIAVAFDDSFAAPDKSRTKPLRALQ